MFEEVTGKLLAWTRCSTWLSSSYHLMINNVMERDTKLRAAEAVLEEPGETQHSAVYSWRIMELVAEMRPVVAKGEREEELKEILVSTRAQ